MGFQFQFQPVLNRLDVLLDGLWVTLQLAGSGILLGALLGILLAMLRGLSGRPVRMLVDAYVELVRNTPFLVQLLIIFFGVPTLGLRLSAEQAALAAIIINLGAYATEIVRAGIESVHKSQIEAGLSLAMTRWQVFRHVVLAPALARVWPALSSQFVLMMLSTSVCSFISVQELSAQAANIESETFRSFEVYILVTLIYLALALVLRGLLAGLGALLFPAGSGLGRLRGQAGR
ncbi:amino acid ABC transporter permease [Paracraurococcus ruber]|uniref:ABC transporter permease n=1 Tax=Paracraurococcus ruber TaxID=77675 RepID=A0ABS1CTL6_9PROT|nr:amino acid ABC transporter permease [Paracraurococcus ruber]MBK1657824.1 ABC transporter permease [Paracraurococcus ruber]TDG31397.1 amino acid ABC transporter permease [Paracraurococcus ruber]